MNILDLNMSLISTATVRILSQYIIGSIKSCFFPSKENEKNIEKASENEIVPYNIYINNVTIHYHNESDIKEYSIDSNK